MSDFPQVTYIKVEFSPPTRECKDKSGEALVSLIHANKNKDKNRKILIGLKYAQSINCSYAMIVDSDDCINRKIAEFVSQNSHKNGWFIGSGYEYEEGTNFVRVRRKNLYQKTGTSNIIRLDLLEKDIKISLEEIDSHFLHHQCIVDWMRARGTPLELLPFNGTIYITDNGENNWAQKDLFWQRTINVERLTRFYLGKIYKPFITRPLDQTIRDEFGIYNLPSD